MPVNPRPPLAPLFLICSIIAGTTAAADSIPDPAVDGSADPDRDLPMEDIIVTASRVPLPLEQTGTAVSVIDQNLLENRQSVFTVEALQDLPGVAVSRTAGVGSLTQVRIRGAEANQVLVVIDGVEANDPALADAFDFTTLQSYDIARVEVLRGPQSALWGSDATAGVISVTTREGAPGFSARTFLEGGSFDTVYGGGSASYTQARGGIDVNASYFDSDGEDASIAGDEEDGYDSLNVSSRLRYQPTDNSTVSLFGRYTSSSSDYDSTDFSTGLPADADLSSDDELLLTGLSGELDLFEGTWQQSLRLTYLDSDHQQQDGGVNTAQTRAGKTGVYYQSTFALPVWQRFSNQYLVLAVDYEDEDFKQRGSAFGAFDPNQNQSMSNTGYIAEFLTSPSADLNLSASVRFDDSSDFDDVTTYRFTASYLFRATNSRLHSSYGKGQKSPTFTERFGFYPDQFVGNPDLEPEQNHGFDIGVQQRLFGERVSVDVTLFRERLKDEIDGFLFDPDAGLFTAGNRDGTSRRDGVEIEASGRLPAGWSVGLSYTYTDSREPDDSGGTSRELRRPQHTASANLNRRLFGGRGNANVNLSYVSDQRDQFFPPFPALPETVSLDSYLIVDVAGSYRLTPEFEIYARANNLFDDDHQNVFGYRGPGRAAYVGVRMKL